MHDFVEITLAIDIVIETTGSGFSCYAPAVPGCIAVGETIEELKHLMQEALHDHIHLTLEDCAKQSAREAQQHRDTSLDDFMRAISAIPDDGYDGIEDCP
jgi:predicted RNase H-like HicB family nuclease